MSVRFAMHSRCLGWDARFFYIEQSMWKGGEAANHMLIRMAITSPQGIVAPARVALAGGYAEKSPPLPEWVTAWAGAEALRPWPPARAG